MAISIKNAETERLARELAQTTGESITEAITNALKDRLVRERGRAADMDSWMEGIREIQREIAQLPVSDDRPPDEILGYDEYGLPT